MTEQIEQNDNPVMNEAPAERAGGARSLRDPGSGAGRLLAWLAIIGVVGFLALTPVAMTFFPGLFEEDGEGPEGFVVVEHYPPSAPMRLIAKYSLGASQFFNAVADGGGVDSEGAEALSVEDQLIEQVDALAAASYSDELRAAMFAAAMLGNEEGLERLDAIEDDAAQDSGDLEPKKFGPEFAEAFAIAKRVMTEGSETLDDVQRESIVESDGWFGELLLVSDLPENDPARKELYDNAQGVATLMIVALFGLLGVGVVGLGLFITAIVLLTTGKVRRAYAPPAPGGSVYLEMFALFLVSFIVIQFAAGVVYSVNGIDLSKYMVWLILPVMFWPLARGADWATWKHAVGWHTGKGVFREIGAGVLGYLAGLPIVAFGLFCAVVLSMAVQLLVELMTDGAAQPASHPAIDEIGSGGTLGVVMLYLLATVWAPLFEETFFRGALFHHMRGRFGVIFSALSVAFIFAAIHPQGIGLIPGLMGLAVVFALLREWRGSIIASMVAHSMHNATLITVLLLALG